MHTSAGTHLYCKFTAEELLAIPSEMFDGARHNVIEIFEGETAHNDLKFKQDLFAGLLDPSSMVQFIEWYFNNLTPSKRSQMFLQKAELPTPDRFPQHLSKGCDNRPVREFRKKGHHALSTQEYLSVVEYVESHYPQLPSAMRLIEFGIKAYVSAVDYHVTRPLNHDDSFMLQKRSVLAKAQDGLYNGGRIGSVISEFLPVILYPAAQATEDLSPKLLAHGIKQAFASPERNTFTSSEIKDNATPNGFEDVRTCPLKQAIGHVMNMTLNAQEDGYFSRGKPSSGGLLFFAMDFNGRTKLMQMVRDTHTGSRIVTDARLAV